MKMIKYINQSIRILAALVFCLIGFACDKTDGSGSGEVVIQMIEFEETRSRKYLDFPDNGTIRIDNPYFDFHNPDTWTGNIEKYVKESYTYNVDYAVRNVGDGKAYDVILKLNYVFDNGEEEDREITIGAIGANSSFNNSSMFFCQNKQLVKCRGKVYWGD